MRSPGTAGVIVGGSGADSESPSWEPEPFELPLYEPDPRVQERRAPRPGEDSPEPETSERDLVIVIDLA